MKGAKRSMVIAGHRTSISLEGPFWDALKDIAAAEGRSVADLVTAIDAGRTGENLSSAIRLHVLAYYRAPVGCCAEGLMSSGTSAGRG